ncbi:MAG TPA: hypothetical protein VFW68_06190 [Rhodocyclaceae bacterium]|nr:hypothetical protein [Rhodocyclaceae bacterium]
MPRVLGVNVLRELEENPPAGLSPVRTRLRRDAVALIKAESLIDAAYSYRLVPLDRPASAELHADGEVLYAPRLMPESGQLTMLGVGVCTLGPRIGERCTALFAEKRASLAVALDELGIEALFAVGRRLQDRILTDARRQGLTVAGELHAGDPGLDISAQAAVLRLADATSIGVGLHKGHLITPLKSGSVVYGIGIDLPEVEWSRCDNCPSKSKCTLAQKPRGKVSSLPNLMPTV